MKWALLPERWHRLGIRRLLLTLAVPLMLLAMALELTLTWHAALQAANAAYDRSLLGAIKAIDANVSTETGGLSVELPYQMLEFFELTASGPVYFRVSTEDGLVEVGNAGLPMPARRLANGVPRFIDAEYFGDPVRVGALARELDPERPGRRMIIQVAETTLSRNAFSRSLLLQAVGRDVVTLLLVAAVLALVIRWALQPLERLRREVQARADDDLSPVDESGVPADAAPLVRAINHHVQRHHDLIEAQRRFVDDASHQLRTPLATLATQVGYALRERDPLRRTEALAAIKLQIDDTIRRTNQMLALAGTETVALPMRPFDLNLLAERCTREAWPDAREHGVDLGFEPASEPALLMGNDGQLREALLNLLHNSLRYTPRGGQVTLQVLLTTDSVAVQVLDDGPGIPAAERPRVGERFFRGSNVDAPGSGLGLAIVRSITAAHRGRMQVRAAQVDHAGVERGLGITLVFPRCPVRF